jgi:hypothetical protein
MQKTYPTFCPKLPYKKTYVKFLQNLCASNETDTCASSDTDKYFVISRMDDWLFVFICLLVLDDDGTNNLPEVCSQYHKKLYKSLGIIERHHQQRKIPRYCVQDPSKSAWQKLYRSQNDLGMITLTGFDCAIFAYLCAQFAPVFNSYTPFVPSRTLCFERRKQTNKGLM